MATNFNENYAENFESKLKTLLKNFQEIRAQKRYLEEKLAEKEQELQNANAKISQLEENYKNLKMAKLLCPSNENKELAVARLTAMIKEVENCMRLMKD